MLNFKQILERHPDTGNAADKAYAVIREAILENVFSPGERLRADQLADKLGNSKTPVREALRKLQAESLVVEQGGGLAVRTVTEEQLFEIYQTREALEGMVARLAAERIQPAELAALRATVETMKSHRGNAKKIRALKRNFIASLLRASRNDTAHRILKQLHDHIRQFSDSTTTYPGRPREFVTFCVSLLAAIEKRDGEEAERLARANCRRLLGIRILMLHSARRV